MKHKIQSFMLTLAFALLLMGGLWLSTAASHQTPAWA